MIAPPRVIRDNDTLYSCYNSLKRNDIVCGRVRFKPQQEHLFTDLLDRGIRFIPSASAQLASKSKVFQVQIFKEFMLPETVAIYDHHSLLEATALYHKKEYSKVILKCDRKNAGLGVYLFQNVEDLYNTVCIGEMQYPFVIQPFVENSRDIRVIIIGDYLEAYERVNPDSFRNNLHCGGRPVPCHLSQLQKELCQQVMVRGNFPYAHIDLLVFGSEGAETTKLMEINLRGGLKGANLIGKRYQEMTTTIHEEMVSQLLEQE